MKTRIYAIWAAMLLALGACSDELHVTEPEDVATEIKEIPVKLTLEVMPQANDEGTTRANYVAGEDAPSFTASTRVKLLCFDVTGYFVTARDGVIKPSTASAGDLEAVVPSNTARVHFLVNYPTGMSIAPGPETSLMQHLSMTVSITDDMTYWGYHRESNSSAMVTWLKNNNTLYLLRDRAQLKVVNADANITSVEWTVSNGLSRGLMAPKALSNSGSAVSYTNDYDNEANLGVTQFAEGGSYTITLPAGNTAADYLSYGWTSAGTFSNYTANGWNSAGDAQYLMEDRNMREPVKVLLRVTFSDATVRFFTMKLLDDRLVPVTIRRNHRYLLKMQNVDKSRGYNTAQAALAATTYANDPYADVEKSVVELSDGQKTLILNSFYKYIPKSSEPGSEDFHSIGFRYYNNSTPNLGVDGGRFIAVWMDKDVSDLTPEAASDVSVEPTVVYNHYTGDGTVSFLAASVENSVKKHSILRLISSDSGMYRDIDIYSIGYTFSPTLVKTGNQYRLSFSLPPGLPQDIFPLTFRFCSWTLQPNTLEYDNTQVANVVMATTDVEPIHSESTEALKQWNYKAKEWNKWYECKIEYSNSLPATFSVLLDDKRADIDKGKTNSTYRPTQVGLYFQVQGLSDVMKVGPLN